MPRPNGTIKCRDGLTIPHILLLQRNTIGLKILTFLLIVAFVINIYYIHVRLSNYYTLPSGFRNSSLLTHRSSSPLQQQLPDASDALQPHTTRRTEGITEFDLFERLRTKLEVRWENQQEEGRSLIMSPELLQALRSYSNSLSLNSKSIVRGEDHIIPNKVNTNRANSCQAPLSSSTACHETEYVLIATAITLDLRILFLNCLKWLVDSSVREIWILMPLHNKAIIQVDTIYGYQLLAWNKHKASPVKLVFAETLWEALREVETSTHTTSSAMLWANADTYWEGSWKNIRSSFELWKQSVSAFVAVSFVVNNEGQSRLHQPDTTIRGYFYHRDYLCFLYHPSLDVVRNASLGDWYVATWAVALWLGHVATACVGVRDPKASFFDDTTTGTSIVSQKKTITMLFGGVPYCSNQLSFPSTLRKVPCR